MEDVIKALIRRERDSRQNTQNTQSVCTLKKQDAQKEKNLLS